MDVRVLLFLFTVNSVWCCNARDLTSAVFNEMVSVNTNSDLLSAVQQSHNKLSGREAQHMKEVMKNETLCSLCEEYSTDAVCYLSENKTQTEIIDILHKICARIPTFSKQCIALVDYYAPLFFIEVSSIEPAAFCQKFGVCEVAISFPQYLSKNNKCDVCHNMVIEALLKLKDPDTELEVVEVLLKACNSIKNDVKKCKRLVFEYAPIVLVNVEKFLETNDVCTILHACDEVGAEQAVIGSRTDTTLLSAS
ncbi:uncharacterized protein LOC142548604 isoform X3 [Primulina tabacum]